MKLAAHGPFHGHHQIVNRSVARHVQGIVAAEGEGFVVRAHGRRSGEADETGFELTGLAADRFYSVREGAGVIKSEGINPRAPKIK